MFIINNYNTVHDGSNFQIQASEYTETIENSIPFIYPPIGELWTEQLTIWITGMYVNRFNQSDRMGSE